MNETRERERERERKAREWGRRRVRQVGGGRARARGDQFKPQLLGGDLRGGSKAPLAIPNFD